MFSAFQDLIAKAEKKMQYYQMIFDFITLDLKVNSSTNFFVIDEIVNKDFQ